MTWVSEGISFRRDGEKILPIATRLIGKDEVVFCELPTKSKGDHKMFAMACAKLWGQTRRIFPCTFNADRFKGGNKEFLDRVFKGCKEPTKTLASSLRTECPEPYLFTAFQVFEEGEGTGVVTLPNEGFFLVSLRELEKGEVIRYGECGLNEEINREILIRTTPLKGMFQRKCSPGMERILEKALEMMDGIQLLDTPTEKDIEEMRDLVQNYNAREYMGLNKFKKTARGMIDSVKRTDEPFSMDAMEAEYDRLLNENYGT